MAHIYVNASMGTLGMVLYAQVIGITWPNKLTTQATPTIAVPYMNTVRIGSNESGCPNTFNWQLDVDKNQKSREKSNL